MQAAHATRSHDPELRFPAAAARPRRAFSLIEMLATVAALVILLGLMVSLARYVRKQASDQLTKQLLAQLDTVVRQYQGRYKTLPAVPPFVPGVAATQPAIPAAQQGGTAAAAIGLPVAPMLPPADDALPEESALQQNARLNNRAIVSALRVEARRFPLEFAALPQAFFEGDTLLDAWGTPLVFMPALHPAVGMAMENRPFFLSAGPDRQFRTLEDNLYSYEEGTENPVASSQ